MTLGGEFFGAVEGLRIPPAEARTASPSRAPAAPGFGPRPTLKGAQVPGARNS